MVDLPYQVIVPLIFGVLGGYVHELIQNKRRWQRYFVDPKTGDIFIGSWAALIFGGVSGLIVGLVLPIDTTMNNAAYVGLTAGLSLKGLAEAYTTKQPSSQTTGQPPQPPTQ